MAFSLLVVLFFVAGCSFSAEAADCGYPNGTETGIHTYQCPGTYAMVVTNATAVNDGGDVMYPINPKEKIIIELTAVNNGVPYVDNKSNVKIYQYSSDWLTGKCGWQEIPTFGLLNNIDGCEFANNCPLVTGNLVLKLPLDLTQFSSIISTLVGNKAYMLNIEMHNYNPGSSHEAIACVNAQLRFGV